MLRNVNHSIGFTIHATDGEIGKVTEFYFDDVRFAVRYLVVNTGNWLAERFVLVSPMSVQKIDWEAKRIDVRLTKSQVEKSPDINTQQTVSRQHESEFLLHYGYPNYWDGPFLWGRSQQPAELIDNPEIAMVPGMELEESHLRGTKEVKGYHIEGVDGQIGHVEDFIVDEESWAVRYFVVNTSNWWAGRKILVSPEWIANVSWEDSKVHVELALQAIKNAPEYKPDLPITREYEHSLYNYYHRTAYWLPKAS